MPWTEIWNINEIIKVKNYLIYMEYEKLGNYKNKNIILCIFPILVIFLNIYIHYKKSDDWDFKY